MTPLAGFQELTSRMIGFEPFISYTEDIIDIAVQSSSEEEQAATVQYLETALEGDDEQLMWAWSRSNAQIGFGPRGIRMATELVIARIRDPSAPKIHRIERAGSGA